MPTVGFNVEYIDDPNDGSRTLWMWDAGGRAQLRRYWYTYLHNTQGVIFVVDSSDRQLLNDFKEELERLRRYDALSGVPFLFVANKQELPNAMSIAEREF